jgi:hypothetical protein
MKPRGPKLPCSNYFLGGGHTQEVATTRATMEIIQDSVIFVDGQTLTNNGVEPTLI